MSFYQVILTTQVILSKNKGCILVQFSSEKNFNSSPLWSLLMLCQLFSGELIRQTHWTKKSLI